MMLIQFRVKNQQNQDLQTSAHDPLIHDKCPAQEYTAEQNDVEYTSSLNQDCRKQEAIDFYVNT